MFFTHTDARVGGIEITRTYNSVRAIDGRQFGVLGSGWNMSHESRLRILSWLNPGAVELRLPDGTPAYYAVTSFASNIYTQELPFSTDSWIVQGQNAFTRVFRRGGSETYEAYGTNNMYGRLTAITDAAGHTTSYQRDLQQYSDGRVVSITREGRTVTLTYDGWSGKLSELRGPNNQLLATYIYDAHGRLEGVNYPATPPNVLAGGYRFHFPDGHENPYDLIESVTDAAGNPIEKHLYDPQHPGRALTSELGGGIELLNFNFSTPGQTTVTDALGHLTTYEWEPVVQVKRVTKVTGPCGECGAGTSTTREWKYDDKGRIKEYVDASGTTGYVYDPTSGDLLSETNPLSQTITYTYWPDGRLRRRTNPNGGFVEFSYVPAGPDTIKEAIAPAPTALRETHLEYTNGRVEWITDPRGKRTQLSYDTRGDLVAITDPLGTATPNNPNDHMTRFEYNDLGQRTAVVDPLAHRTETTYDSRGNVLRVREFDDGSVARDTTYTYDGSGHRLTATDANGHTTENQYDAYGRLWKVFQPSDSPDRPLTTLDYDVMSNLTSITDAEARLTTFHRDTYDRIDTITYPGQREESFTYDTWGRLWTRARGGITTTFSYDSLNRLTSKAFSDGTPSYSFAYDANGDVGFLTSASHGGHSLAWDYDLAGQLRSEVSSATSGPTDAVSYTYWPDGSRKTLALNAADWLTYDYDDASRLDLIHRGTEVFDFGFDDAGRRATLEFPNLVHAQYGYDTMSRLLSLAMTRNQSTIASSSYTYDPAGNRLTKTHPGFAETYLYDALDRLKTVTGDNAGQYTYDKVGNRNPGTWTYNVRNELTANGDSTFTYDLRGNRETKVVGGVTWRYEWTAEDRLKRILRDGSEIARYAYDPLGRRIERIVGSVMYTYLYDGEDVLREDFTSMLQEPGMVDPPPHLYVHGPGIDEPLAVKHGNDVEWFYLPDGLGSLLKATDIVGVPVYSRTYDAFGNQPQSSSTDVQGYAFTGREWDPESGLYYYRARYYDPKIGRFISEDPLGFVDGPNVYTYVRNNPVRYVDPWGLASCECPSAPKNCLELLFKQPVGGVQIVTKPPSTKWDATTRKNKIIVYGSCDDLFNKPDTVLEEYHHVLRQWNTGRLSRLKYAVAWIKDGYDNKWERESKAWTKDNIQQYLDCLASQN